MRTKIVKSTYLSTYRQKQPLTLSKHLNRLKETDAFSFGYSISYAAVHSSMIEGNPIDFDSYLSYTASGMNTKSKSYQEIQSLIKAYNFARETPLTYANFLKAHALLSSSTIEEERYRGRIRDRDVYVFAGGERVYTGIGAADLPAETDTFFNDIHILLQRSLSLAEVFYFASMLHLVFVQIHPFADGNGRAARLLEKWFLAERLGLKAWLIKSEKLYQRRIQSYYKNVNIGSTYHTLNYALSVPFLLMLPMALRIK